MLERMLVALLIIAAGTLIYLGWRRWQLQRHHAGMLGLDSVQPGLPFILYFTTPDCVPCRTVQRPALHSLQQTFGEKLQLVTIDAAEQPEVADHWGVLTIPTTFVFDREGTPVSCNMGVANTQKLLGQLKAVGLHPPQTQTISTQPVLEK